LLTNCAFIILDHSNGQYAYAHESLKNFGGYEARQYIDSGWEFIKRIVPEVDYEFGNGICHRLVFEHLYKQPVSIRHQFLFSKDHMFCHADGTRFHMLQKGMVLKCDTKGNIQLTLHIVTNINNLKKENTCCLVMVGPNRMNQIYTFDTNSKVLVDEGSLTSRESEILVLLAQKMDTKHIAAKLFISPHTVDTHRRHLLAKLNCVDTTALVTYCKLCGLI
jgi:DNA-binding CsgD family transcriptional regulator